MVKAKIIYTRGSCFLKNKLQHGFTLIELLIVMAILAVLAGFVMVGYPNATKRARDAQRRNDLGQFRNLLENYANKTDGFYPSTSGSISSSQLCIYLSSIIGTISCENDPKEGEDCDGNSCGYLYQANSCGAAGSSCATQYVLWAPLEKGIASGSYWVVCSTGVSGEDVSISPTGGACPI